MSVAALLLVSLFLQLLAAGIALSLIRVTGRGIAWILIASGITLMALRRAVSAYRLLSGDPTHEVDLSAEWIALVISALMCGGLIFLVPLFRSMTRAGDALRESRRVYATLVSNLPGMAYRCRNDANWTMEFVSEGCKELTGYNPADLVENGTIAYAELIQADDRGAVWEDVQAAIKERGPFRLIYRIRTRAGEERWVWEQGRGIFSNSGQLAALEGFITDITDRKRAEETLACSERRSREQLAELDVIYDTAPVGLCIMNTDLRFLKINQRLARMNGLPVEQHIGRTLREVIPEIAPKLEPLYRQVIESGQPILEVEVRGVTPAEPREERSYEVSYYPITVDAKVVGIGVVVQDITVRKRAEETVRRAQEELETRVADRTAELTAANERLRREIAERERAEVALRETEQRAQAVIDNSTAVIYVKDLDGRYILANRRYSEIFNLPYEGIVGRTDHELHPRENADAFRANDQAVLKAGRAVEFEEIAPHVDGPHTYISLKFPLFDEAGGPCAVCGISTDISERKQAARELEAAKNAAEAANRAKSAFLANVSHEIRTPITALLGAAELLGTEAGVEARQRDRASMILRNGRHLLSLIDDLLDLSRAEAGKLECRVTRCSLVEVITDVVAVTAMLHRRPAVDFRIVYDTAVPATISTDPTRLRQALINLVNNALKFTDEGRVWVRLSCLADAADPRLVIAVEDTGTGIEPCDAERVFEPFTQASPTGVGIRGGVGLGLPLARFIARQLGGSLELTPSESRGCTFTLRLATGPLDDATWTEPHTVEVPVAAPHAEAEREPHPHLTGRVLVAEDFADTRVLMSHALTSCGTTVTAVDNGRDAVAAARETAFDLVLMDIRMPQLDGIEATRQLRGEGCLAPIIALTASTTDEGRERLLEAGFDDLWIKPLTVQALLRSAAYYLSADSLGVDPKQRPQGEGDTARTADRLALAIAEFTAGLPDRLRELRRIVESGDNEQAYEILHQLIGACGIHGLTELSHEAARLQPLAGERRLSGAPEELGYMESLVGRAVAALPSAHPPTLGRPAGA